MNMSEMTNNLKELFCLECRAPLGSVGLDHSAAGFICRKCNRQYTIVTQDGAMTLKVIGTKKENGAEGTRKRAERPGRLSL